MRPDGDRFRRFDKIKRIAPSAEMLADAQPLAVISSMASNFPLACSGCHAYQGIMAKMKTSSWLPKGKSHTSAASGKFVSVKRVGGSPATSSTETAGSSGKMTTTAARGRSSSLLRNIRLPNGDVITSIRGDVMDRALRRGDFKKA